MEINDIRVGQGYDVHKFAENRELWLCGVLVDYKLGLAGHSDADVAIHALMDAILGAGGYRDIGYYFPDTDDSFKGIDSKILLTRVIDMIFSDGWKLSNIDLTIIAERPKLKNYIENMKKVISGICKVDISRVSIKATTTEKLGFTGRKEGIASISSVLIIK